MSVLESGSFTPLCGSHRATPAKLRFSDAVNKMRGADQKIEVEGPVLAVFEGPEAVENDRFDGGRLGAKPFVEE